MAFSLTTIINIFFGSLVMVFETGVILNNQMNGKHFFGKFLGCLKLHFNAVLLFSTDLFIIGLPRSSI